MNRKKMVLKKFYGVDLPSLIFAFCFYSTLVETLQSMDLSALKPFPPGQPEKFASFLDKVLGLQ